MGRGSDRETCTALAPFDISPCVPSSAPATRSGPTPRATKTSPTPSSLRRARWGVVASWKRKSISTSQASSRPRPCRELRAGKLGRGQGSTRHPLRAPSSAEAVLWRTRAASMWPEARRADETHLPPHPRREGSHIAEASAQIWTNMGPIGSGGKTLHYLLGCCGGPSFKAGWNPRPREG